MSGGNVKAAPLALTPALVAKLTGDRPAYGSGIAHVPIEGSVGEERPGFLETYEPLSPEDFDEIGGGLDW